MDNPYNVTINVTNTIDESVANYWKNLKVEYGDNYMMGETVVCEIAGILVVGEVIWVQSGSACVHVTEPVKLEIGDYHKYSMLHHGHFAVPLEETIAVTR